MEEYNDQSSSAKVGFSDFFVEFLKKKLTFFFLNVDVFCKCLSVSALIVNVLPMVYLNTFFAVEIIYFLALFAYRLSLKSRNELIIDHSCQNEMEPETFSCFWIQIDELFSKGSS